MFIVTDVEMTVQNGMTTTRIAKSVTRIVTGILHLPKSTMDGCVDFPDTVMYSFFPTMKFDTYKIINATAMRKTARQVACVSPSSFPICT